MLVLFLLLYHPICHPLGQKVRPFQVYAQDTIEALLRRLKDIKPGLRGHAGVVDKNIEPPKLLLSSSYQFLAFCSDRNIGLNVYRPNPGRFNPFHRLLGFGKGRGTVEDDVETTRS